MSIVRRPILHIATAVLIVGSLGAWCGNPDENSSTQDAGSVVFGTPQPIDEQLQLLTLIQRMPRDGKSYEIQFEWTSPSPGLNLGPGVVVWRESDEVWRRDSTITGRHQPRFGEFRLFVNRNDLAKQKDCLWSRTEKTTVQGTFLCEGPDVGDSQASIFAAIEEALESTTDADLGQQEFADRSSSCFRLSKGGRTTGAVCIDDEIGLPLYLEVVHPLGSYSHTIRATDVREFTEGVNLILPSTPIRGQIDLGSLELPSSFSMTE